MHHLSVAIITYNEAGIIHKCLDALENVADDIIIVDSYSTDGTPDIVKQYSKVRCFRHPFEGHIQQKNIALSYAHYDLVLALDADEVLSETLSNSIASVKENFQYDGYTLNRITNYCGHWIRHSGWYPDRKVRLVNKNKACWNGQNPHDKLALSDGSGIGQLKGDLLHYSYKSVSDHLNQINTFTSIMAGNSHAKRTSVFKVLFSPLWSFIKGYFIKRGFLDGWAGFIVCVNGAFYRFIKQIKILEKQGFNKYRNE